MTANQDPEDRAGQTSLDRFLSVYNPDGAHPVTEIEATTVSGQSPFIIIRHGEHAVVINPLAFDDHLSVDVHPYVGGAHAAGGVLAMTEGRQFDLAETGRTSHGWPAANLVAVLVGKQATTDPAQK